MVIVYSRLTNSPINIMSTNKAIHVFLSHNSVDKPQVEQVAHRLQDAGFDVWLDKWNLIPGDPWQEGIEDALDECDCCLVFVGREGNIGPWQNVEMRAAIDHQVSTQRLRVIPVLLPGSERGDPGQLPTFLRRNTWVEFRYSLDEPDTFTLLVAGIKHEKPPIEGELVNSENPYRGLEVFDIEHSRFFFGRKAVTEWLLNAVRPSEARDSHARFRDNRFLAIVGASGSGKSSVARAGLLAALQQGQLPNSEHWPQIDFTPGEKPLQNLALALKKHPQLPSIYQVEHTELRRKFLEQPLQLHSLALEWLKGNGQQRLVILADQFEEIFTLCRNDAERQAFLDNLLHAAYDSTGQVIVILTLRADFYPNLTPYEQLSRAVEAHQYLLNPLNETELREAITLPAQLSGAEVEALLVDDLVKDTLEQPGSLPLLQFALSRLWKQRSERVLRLKEYREFGGLIGALEQRANGVYESLSPDDQAQCRLVFRRLVQPGEGTTDTRRRARLDEFSGDQQRIVRLMVDERLLTTRRDSIDSDESDDKKNIADSENTDFVEVAHEALIGGWPRLKNWVSKDRISIQTQHLVSSAAKEWDSSGRKVKGLLPEARLLDAEQWVGDYPEQATLVERVFVESEGRVVRRQRNRVKWFAGVMAVVAVGMVVLASFAFQQRSTAIGAKQSEKIAKESAEKNAKESKQRELEANYNLAKAFEEKSRLAFEKGKNTNSPEAYKQAILYALEAELMDLPMKDVGLTSNTFGLLSSITEDEIPTELKKTPHLSIKKDNENSKGELNIELMNGHSKKINSFAIHPTKDAFLASASEDGSIRFWDIRKGEGLRSVLKHDHPVMTLAYTSSGKELVSGTRNGEIYVWKFSKEIRLVNKFKVGDSFITAIVHKPSSDSIAIGLANGDILLMSIKSGEIFNTVKTNGEVNYLLYDRHGDRLFSASGGVFSDEKNIKVWDSKSMTLIAEIEGHSKPIQSLAYNHKRKLIASGSLDETIKIWSSEDYNLISTLENNLSFIESLAFNSNGEELISGSISGKISLWKLEHNVFSFSKFLKNPSFKGKNLSVSSVSYSLNNELIASSCENSICFWKNSFNSSPKIAEGHTDIVDTIKFSDNGVFFVTGSYDSSIKVWNSTDRSLLKTILGSPGFIYSVSFSPDNKNIASASTDASIRLWSTENYSIKNSLHGHTQSSLALEYSADGKNLISAAYDKTIREWSLNSMNEKKKILLENSSLALTYGNSDREIFYGIGNNVIWHNLSDGSEKVFKGHTSEVTYLGYGRKNSLLASGSNDNTVRLWDAESGKLLQIFEGHSDGVVSLMFNSNEEYLASASSDGDLRLWNIKSGKLKKLLRTDDSVFSLAYHPTENVIATGTLKDIRFWDLDSVTHRILYDFDPRIVSTALKFLWEMELDGLNFKHKTHPISLAPQMGHHISWTDETRKFRPLLDMPKPGETKLQQLVRWLEEQKAYRKTPAGVPQ